MGSRKDKDSNLDLKKLAADMENQKDGAAEAERRKEDAMNRSGWMCVRVIDAIDVIDVIDVCFMCVCVCLCVCVCVLCVCDCVM